MPKLDDALASKVDSQESTGSREPLPPNEYRARLRSITPKVASTGSNMWTAEWEVVEGEHSGRLLWSNLVFVDTALWKVKEFFDAFGVPSSTHSDELLSCTAKLVVSQRIIQSGPKQGQLGNNIDATLPDESPAAVHPSVAGATKPAAAAAASTAKVDPAEF